MKNLLLILIFILINVIQLFSQCGTTTYCPNKEYNYMFCNSAIGKIIEKCSYNPSAETNPPWNVVKTQLPVCLNFCDSGNDIAEMKTKTGGWGTVYSKTFVSHDAAAAAFAWNCVCGKQNETCKCKLNFKFSSDPKDFPTGAEFTTARAEIIVNSSTCATKCNKNCTEEKVPMIRINNSKEFTGVNGTDNKKKKKFFINNEYFNTDPNYFNNNFDTDYTAYNLTDIIMHELGHLLGMGHSKVSGVDKPISFCGNSNGIMGIEIAKNNKSIGLSNDDICAFKKLNCPSLVPVEDEYQPNNETSIYPNPVNDQCLIKFNITSDNDIVSIYLYNSLGINVKTIMNNVNLNYGEHKINVQTDGLNVGQYYYMLKIGMHYFVKSLIVLK